MTARLLHLACAMLAMAMCAAAPVEEPIEHDLPDAQLLELLEELDMTEVIDAYWDARDDVSQPDQLRAELDRLEQETSQDHIGMIEKAMHARSQLLDQATDDRERVDLLMQQAEAALTLLRADQALALTVQAGMPTSAQRRRAVMLARTGYDAAVAASEAVDTLLFSTDDEPGFRLDPVKRQERRRLADDLRDRWIPYLVGLTASMHATIGDVSDAEAHRLAGEAIEMLPALDLPAEAFGIVRCATAKAHLRSGRTTEAMRLFESVVSTPVGGVAEVDRASAALGIAQSHAQARRFREARTHLDLARSQPPFVDAPDRPAALWIVLLADVRFSIEQQHAADLAPGPAHDAVIADSYRIYTRLIDRAPELGVDGSQLRLLVFEKLAGMEAIAREDSHALPPLAMLARASSLARDEATRRAGLELLRETSRRDDIDPDLAAEALHMAATTLDTSDDADGRLAAALLYIDLASRFEASPHAPGAIDRAIALTEWVYRTAPSDDAADAYEQALRLGLTKQPDARRYELGSLLLDRGDIDGAVTELKRVRIGADAYGDALLMIASARSRQLQLAMGSPAERTVAKATLDATRAARAERSGDHDDFLDLLEAQAYLALDMPAEAEAILVASDEETAASIRLRARALRLLDRYDEAAGLIDDLMAMFPDDAGSSIVDLVDAMIREYETGAPPGSDKKAEKLAEAALLPIAQRAVEWASQRDVEHIDDHRVRLGRALLLAGRHDEALVLLAEYAERRPSDLRCAMAFADAQFALGHDEDSFASYSRIIRNLSASGEYGDAFWAASLRRLLILERTGKSIDQIVPRIRGLETIDQTLGGDRYEQQFRALERRIYTSQGG
ncbi:MAG: hypothetical protein KAS72_07190 [Phycisphaerales bacterium]|nr:hypothetical protein [Phycisphaerales bacterium]